MGLWSDQLLPRLTHWTLDKAPIEQLRRHTVSGLAGEVLEVGFGSGLTLPCYPPGVTRVWALDPALAKGAAPRLARPRIAQAPFEVRALELSGEDIPLKDGSVDAVVSIFTLCTIPDLPRALREVARVLAPDGVLRYLEHGRSPHPSVARWQDRLTPLQKRFAGGCHLNRAIDDELRAAGFALTRQEHPNLPGPRVATYLFLGEARPGEP